MNRLTRTALEAEREYAMLPENNTAQERMLDAISFMEPGNTHGFIFKKPMCGDLDFAEAQKEGFKRIDSIVFESPGKITSIRNLPPGIKLLGCAGQLLTELEDLPDSLEELVLTNNYIETMDMGPLARLKKLHIAFNELKELKEFPAMIDTVICDNNKLTLIDLDGVNELRVLHCSNNPILVLRNKPHTVVDFQMENNPLVELDRTRNHDKKSEAEANEKYTFLEALRLFFKLKNDYDSKDRKRRRDLYKKILEKGSKKEAVRMARATESPCINCKRKVGTTFSTKNNKYIAVCGDKKSPCNLDIQLFSGFVFDNEMLLETTQTHVASQRENMIKEKLNTLFNYVSEKEAVSRFKRGLEQYTKDNDSLRDFLHQYNEVHANADRSAQLAAKQQTVYEIQDDISRILAQYRETGNAEMMKEAVEMQINSLEPAIENLRLLKYPIMEVDVDQVPNTDVFINIVVQRSTSLQSMDYVVGEPSRVVKFTKK